MFILKFYLAGSPCQLGNGNKQGICKSANNCSWLRNEIRAKRIRHADLPSYRCGFSGTTEIVCCGDETPPTVVEAPPNKICIDSDDICFE